MRSVSCALLIAALTTGWEAFADNVYTNLAGNAIAGKPCAITAQTVTFAQNAERSVYRLAIFPEGEKRRIAAELGSTQFVPRKIQVALAGVEKAVARMRDRVGKGLATKEQCAAFLEREREHVRRYLDHEVDEGRLLAVERNLLLMK